MKIDDFGLISLMFARAQKARLCFKEETTASALFEERGYTTITLKDLMQKLPMLRLPDLLRPLLLNTLIA